MSTDILRFMTVRPLRRTAQPTDAQARVPAYIDLDPIVGADFHINKEDLHDYRPLDILQSTPVLRRLDEFLVAQDDRACPSELLQLIHAALLDVDGPDFDAWVATLPQQLQETACAFAVSAVWSASCADPFIPQDFAGGRVDYILALRRARNEFYRRVKMAALAMTITTTGEQAVTLTDEEVQRFVTETVLLLPHCVPTPGVALSRFPGVADLCTIHQTLIGYEAGEIAHIENVLRGETRQRDHRVLQSREDILTVETEQEQESTKDLQTTDRFELQREIANTTQEDLSLQVGSTVTATYGPVVATANVGLSARTTSQDQQRTATTYAHDVVQRSVDRILERTRQQQVTRVLMETEEKNAHGFAVPVDAPADVVGIYRFVEKVYRAQVFNYGKRLLTEFVVPQPAFFLRYAEDDLPADIVPPQIDDGAATGPRALRPSDITANSYLDLLAEWNVTPDDLPPYPENVVTVSDTLSGEGGSETNLSTTKMVEIPAGYAATGAHWSINSWGAGMHWIRVSCGDKRDEFTSAEPGASQDWDLSFATPFTKVVPCTFVGAPIVNFQIAVVIHCSRIEPSPGQWASSTLRKWQASVFEAVMQGYRQRKADRDAAVSQRESARGEITPDEHRALEHAELKKHIIDMLGSTGIHTGAGNPVIPGQAADPGPLSPRQEVPPSIDVGAVALVRDEIQFLEQAFEWPQMTYVLYPYYWAMPDQWRELVTERDDDPLYQEFLRAGAARIVVPVRPNFEDCALLYLATGIPWSAGDVPHIGEATYLSAVDEIRSMQQDGGGTPLDSWELRLPTTLVILESQVQQLEDLVQQSQEPPAQPIALDRLDGVPIPAAQGKIGWFGGPDDHTAHGDMTLTGEPVRAPVDPWYCAMRWRYPEGVKDRAWYTGKRIVVSAGDRKVVLRAADYGPREDTGRAITLSQQALSSLGVSTDDSVEIGWAADQERSLGPIT